MDGLHLATAALLSGLLALERKAFLQAMVSRPLVAGTILGLALARPAEGVALGAGLEFFYLGAVSLGASLPDNELFTTIAAVGCAGTLAASASLPMPATLACAVLATLPAAKLGKLVDRLSERLNGWMAAIVEGEGEARRERTGLRHNLYGMWMPFLAAVATCAAGELLGAVLPALLARGPAALPRALSLVWAAFLLVGAAAAARAARTERALAWAGLAAAATAGAQALGSWVAR